MFTEGDSVKLRAGTEDMYSKLLRGPLLWVGAVTKTKGQVPQDEVMLDSGKVLTVNPNDLERV